VKTTADILRRLSSPADYLLLDNISRRLWTIAFDWQLIPSMDRPYFLAGGIDEAKMPAALARQPFGIDISSGAETQGLKDRDKIRRLLELARRADGGQKS
jgi:phosphoribosylanthranilate isomerase